MPQLRFRPLLAEIPLSAPTPAMPSDEAGRAAVESCTIATLLQVFPDPANIPTTSVQDDKSGVCVVLTARNEELRERRYFLGPAALTAKDISGARVAFIAGEGYVVNLKLKRSGSRKINKLAADLFAKPEPQNEVAVVLNAEVVSLPTFQSADFGNGPVEISGRLAAKKHRTLPKRSIAGGEFVAGRRDQQVGSRVLSARTHASARNTMGVRCSWIERGRS
jgi:hypothetical protein